MYKIQSAARLRQMPHGFHKLRGQVSRMQDHFRSDRQEDGSMRKALVSATAILVLALAWPNLPLIAADKRLPGAAPVRDEARDQKSIELAKAIMAGNQKFRDALAGADPNAVIYINYGQQKYDLSLLTIATLLGAKEAIDALTGAGARIGDSCDIGYLVAVSQPLNSILAEFTSRRAALPRIMAGQAELSCYLSAPYRKAAKPSDRALIDAIVSGRLEAVQRALTAGADKNAREIKLPGNDIVWPGRTALMIALIERRMVIAEFLIKNGADVNAKAAVASRWGGTDGIDALKIAVTLKQRDVVKVLLAYGADTTAADEDGNLAIHEAAVIGDVLLLEMVLDDDPRRKAKETITVRNKSGYSPLILAVRSNQPNAVNYLIKRSIELYGDDFLEYWGNGAVDEALTLRFVGSLDQVETDDVRRKAGEILVSLLESGADPTFKDERGRTILMRAIQVGFDVKVIQVVLARQPQLDVTDRDGRNAYSFAQDRSDAVEVKELLDHSR